MTDTSVQKLVINRPTKTQFEQLTPNNYELWAVDPEFTGGKILITDSDGDIIESTATEADALAGGTAVQDVEVNGTSVVTDNVASIDLTGYEQKATVTALSATDSITLADNTIFNGSTQTSLTIALWSAPTVSSLCEIVFTSGSTPTTLSYPNTIQWLDRSDDVNLNVFTPVANKRYTVMFYYDGSETVGVVRGIE